MGCDIHIVIEKKFSDKWIGVVATDEIKFGSNSINRRSYKFFTELAGVRGKSDTSFPVKGIPYDVSDLSQALITRWDTDGHSHSYLSLNDFLLAYDRAYEHYSFEKPYRKEFMSYDILGLDTDDDIYRVVFWFDN